MAVWLVPFLIGAACFAFWVWMFWDFMQNRRINPDYQYVWLLAFIFFSVLTAGYYYFTEYRNK